MLNAAQEFCHPGDMLSAGGGCEPAVVTHLQMFMGKALSTVTIYHQPHFAGFDWRLSVGYSKCVRNVMPLWHNTDGSVMSMQWMELVQKIRLLSLRDWHGRLGCSAPHL